MNMYGCQGGEGVKQTVSNMRPLPLRSWIANLSIKAKNLIAKQLSRTPTKDKSVSRASPSRGRRARPNSSSSRSLQTRQAIRKRTQKVLSLVIPEEPSSSSSSTMSSGASSTDLTLSTLQSSASSLDSWNDEATKKMSNLDHSKPIVMEEESDEEVDCHLNKYDEDDQHLCTPPGPRLQLGRKGNHKYVPRLQVLEWQCEKYGVEAHKTSVETQRHALRTLRTTSRILGRPFHRCYWTMEQATPDKTMFSVIPEEQIGAVGNKEEGGASVSNWRGELEHQTITRGEEDAATAEEGCADEDTNMREVDQVSNDSSSSSEDPGEEPSPTSPFRHNESQQGESRADLMLADPYVRLLIDRHNQHQAQNTSGLDKCMDILRHVSAHRGIDEDEEVEGEEPDYLEDFDIFENQGEDSTLTTISLTMDDFTEEEEESTWEIGSIPSSHDSSYQSATSACPSHGSNAIATQESSNDKNSDNNSLVVTDHFANLIIAKHQQHGGHARRRSQSGLEVLQSISSTFNIPAATNGTK